MSAFDDAVALMPLSDDAWRGQTSPAYANMVGPFGGITAAVMLNGAMSHGACLGEPVALTVNFAAPVADGEFSVRARLARKNRSTQHWTLELVQQDAVVATGTTVFALRRESWSALEATPPTNLPRPHDLPRMAVDGRPPWVHRYDMRFVSGVPVLDEQEQSDSTSCLWIRDDPPRPLDLPVARRDLRQLLPADLHPTAEALAGRDGLDDDVLPRGRLHDHGAS